MAIYELCEGGTTIQRCRSRISSLVRALRHAVAQWERRRITRISAWRLHTRQKGWGKPQATSIAIYSNNKCSQLIVHEEQRTFALLELCRGRVHTTHAMLWCGQQTWVPRSRDLETLHEKVRQDNSQGANSLCRHSQVGLPGAHEGRTHRRSNPTTKKTPFP